MIAQYGGLRLAEIMSLPYTAVTTWLNIAKEHLNMQQVVTANLLVTYINAHSEEKLKLADILPFPTARSGLAISRQVAKEILDTIHLYDVDFYTLLEPDWAAIEALGS